MNFLLRRLRTGRTIGRLLPIYATYAILKRMVPLPRLAKRAWQQPRHPRDRATEQQVVAAIGRLRHWIGHDADCLESSLLLYRELSRLGADPILAVGFRKRVQGVEGHAWVSIDGHPVLESATKPPFSTALHFGHGGTLIAASDAGSAPTNRTA